MSAAYLLKHGEITDATIHERVAGLERFDPEHQYVVDLLPREDGLADFRVFGGEVSTVCIGCGESLKPTSIKVLDREGNAHSFPMSQKTAEVIWGRPLEVRGVPRH